MDASDCAMTGAHPRLSLSREVIAVIAIVAALLLAIFARIMTFELRIDEELFVPPARLLANYRLYVDFFYDHVPCAAWLFRGVMLTMGTDYMLLSGRLAVFLAWVLFAVAVCALTFALTRSVVAMALAAVLVLSNDLLLGPTGMAGTNNLLPLSFAYLGMGLFVFALRQERPPSGLVLAAGLMLGVAASTKINFVAFIPTVALSAFFLPRDASVSMRLKNVTLPFAIGGILGSLPVLYYLVTDPDRFLAHVLVFHTGPHAAYWRAHVAEHEEVAVSLADKGKLAYSIWFSGANLFLLFVALISFVQAIIQGGAKTLAILLLRTPFLTVVGALLLSILLSFLPTPCFPQYFAPPLICVLLLFTLSYSLLDGDSRYRLQPALLVAATLVLIVNGLRLIEALPKLMSPRQWTVSRVHQNGLLIAKAMADAGAKGKVATLAPIYPLEGNLPVYLELATGPFIYRSVDYADLNLARYYKTTSPSTIEALFALDPPAAILVGFDQMLEAPLVRYAEVNNYRRVEDFSFKDRYGTADLYLKPGTISKTSKQ